MCQKELYFIHSTSSFTVDIKYGGRRENF